jgi:hypothetical protein
MNANRDLKDDGPLRTNAKYQHLGVDNTSQLSSASSVRAAYAARPFQAFMTVQIMAPQCSKLGKTPIRTNPLYKSTVHGKGGGGGF